MQTITTKYHGPTNTRGSRISATASGCGTRIYRQCRDSLKMEHNHKETAIALMAYMDWAGTMVGGHTKTGMVFVFKGGRDYEIKYKRT